MADFNLSTSMSLPVPVPGTTSGPLWASLLDSCLTLIDAHDHTPGKGTAVPSAGLNINADLSMIGNNLTNVRTVRFAAQPSVTGPSDVGCLYEIGADLYYRDGTGAQIRITQSGSVTGATGTITGLPSGTASASYDAIGGTFIFQSATNIAANLDAGSILIRNTSPNSTSAITLQAPAGLASNYGITLPALPAANAFLTMNSSGVLSSATPFLLGIGTSNLIDQSVTTAKVADQNITQGKLALRATGSTVAAGGVAVSLNSGPYSTSSTTYAAVTNLEVTITTTGRPVVLLLSPFAATGVGFVAVSTNPGTASTFMFYNSTASGAVCESTLANISAFPPSSFHTIDFPAAGTYTYRFFVKNDPAGGANTYVDHVCLVAYEL